MRGEVLVGPERRRRWSEDEKARIIAESLQPGVQVANVARRLASAEPYFTRGAVRHVAPRSLLLHHQTSCRFCYRHPKNQPVHPHPLRSLSRIAHRGGSPDGERMVAVRSRSSCPVVRA